MGNFECSICGDYFDNAEDLAQHIKNDHSSDKQGDKFECSKCGERFDTKDQLKEHMDDEHSD